MGESFLFLGQIFVYHKANLTFLASHFRGNDGEGQGPFAMFPNGVSGRPI